MALHVCTSWNNELVQCHVIQNPFSRLSVGLVSNRISDGSSSGNLCRLPSSLANLAKKDKKSFCICPGRMILIFPDLPKTLQKSPFFPSNSFVYLFVPVGDWLQLQWSAWSDLLYSTDVWFSQLPLFADICYRISPWSYTSSWEGVREATTQFAGSERDISNRKGGKEDG